MKKTILTLLFTFICVSQLTAYDGLLFKPLTGHVFEPRIGSYYQFDDEKLRLDIGASFDLTDFKIGNESVLRIGTDWFTYTRIRSEGKFKFPVETSDYFFGVNSSLKTKVGEKDLYARLRLAHISSHLVDGTPNYNKDARVYSREFLDLTMAYPIDFARLYFGLTYIFSTIPDNVNKLVPQIGFDMQIELNKYFDFVAGLDAKLTGSDNKTSVATSGQAGILWKTSKRMGVSLNLYHYNGNSMHGMYFQEDDEYLGLGFQVVYY